MSKKPAQRRKKSRSHKNQSARRPDQAAGNGVGGPSRLQPGTQPPRPGSALANTTTGRTPEQAQGNGNLILWAGLGAVVLLFWYYHLLVLNQMQDLSDGLAMPDQLLGGFDAEYIQKLQASMDGDAKGQLSYVHKTAGTLFPLFTALVAMLAIALHVPRRGLRWGLWAIPLLFAIVSLWTNPMIDGLIAGTTDLDRTGLASALTVTGWILLFATVATGLAVVIASFVRTFRRKWGEAGLS
ncbi:hypothetical protein ACTXOR_13440 [Arthrobacter rhombi]|uniref:hypothetical protein n=1 Tax=Arthrobacter rhombi TaxID=71253 RepID=UPI003FD32327